MHTVPTNADAATVFQGIADRLEAQGENPFKVHAYRHAVRTLECLNEPVADIAARGELRQVPGFGDAITAKIGEILQTGTCDLYERLKALPVTGPEQARATTGHEAERDEAERDEAEEDLPSPW